MEDEKDCAVPESIPEFVHDGANQYTRYNTWDLYALCLNSVSSTFSHKPSGILTIFVNVVRNERIVGLWRGMAPVSILCCNAS